MAYDVAVPYRIEFDGGVPDLINFNTYGRIVPDFATGVAWNITTPPLFGPGGRIHKCDLFTGEIITAKDIADACIISGNDGLAFDTSAQIGCALDGSALWIPTRFNGSSNHRLSKIDPTTLFETVAFSFSLGVSTLWPISARGFVLDGVQYILCWTSANEIYIIDSNAGTQVAAATISISTSTQCYGVIVGEQTSSTVQKFYMLTSGTSGASARITFRSFTFNKGTSTLSTATLLHTQWNASEFDAGWDNGFSSGIYGTNMMFDPADNSLILRVDRLGTPTGSSSGYLVKILTTSRTKAWSIPVPGLSGVGNVMQQGYDLTGGVLHYVPHKDGTFAPGTYPWTHDATTGPLLIVDTATGAYTLDGGPIFGMSSVNGTRAGLWNNTEQHLIFYDLTGVNGAQGFVAPAVEEVIETCPPCEVDTEPCGDTIEPACNAEWPYDELQPRSVGVLMVAGNIGGGSAMFGGHEETKATANGFWRFSYGEIPIHSNAQIRRWRELEALLEGGAGVICLHAYDGKRAPWLTVGGAIVASAVGTFAAGSTSGSIKVTTGGVPLPGMLFSYLDRLYCLKTVGTPLGSPPVYPVSVFPHIRATIPNDGALEFARPMCRARLAEDGAMSLALSLLQHASPSVDFVEDF